MFDHRQRRGVGGVGPSASRPRQLLGGSGDQREFGDQFGLPRRAAGARLPTIAGRSFGGGSSRPDPLASRRRSAASRPSRYSNSGAASAAIAPSSTTSSIVNGTRHRQRPAPPAAPTEAISASSSNFVFDPARRRRLGNGRPAARGYRRSADSTAGAASSRSGAGTRSMRKAAVVGSGPARQLDPAEPAIRQLGDDRPGFVEQGDVGGRRPRADAGDPQPRAVRHAPERGRDAHPPKAPRQKARAVEVSGMPACCRRSAPANPAARRRAAPGWIKYGAERLVDDRRIEMRHRLVGAEQLDAPHGAEPAAVIEPEPGGEAIERGGVHLAARPVRPVRTAAAD